MSEGVNEVKLMNGTLLEDVVDESKTKLIYVYDFMSMWTFLVELGEVVDVAEGMDYPNLMYVHGQIPNEAPEKAFEADVSDDFDELGNDLNIDDYEDLDFNENWN